MCLEKYGKGNRRRRARSCIVGGGGAEMYPDDENADDEEDVAHMNAARPRALVTDMVRHDRHHKRSQHEAYLCCARARASNFVGLFFPFSFAPLPLAAAQSSPKLAHPGIQWTRRQLSPDSRSL